MRRRLLFIVALVCGLAAAAGVYFYLDRMEETYRRTGDFESVVVAREPIPVRTPIKREALAYRKVPAAYIHPDAYRKIEDVAGKASTAAILPGEQILKSRTAAVGEASEDLALALNPGERAVSVAVNEVSGVSGLLKVGDRVDVAVTFDLEAGETSNSYTSTVIQNVRVLAAKRTSASGGQREGNKAQTVILGVTPAQAQHLVLGSERGTIRMLLRSPADSEVLSIPSARKDHLLR
ncbi:MAG: Flp pilus assembly protein CpaB [Thermoanaerobacterales bacterium]|nr:Flp pilus assembly protein CpaB [Thermoanaerobacterales bacterium]